MSSVTLGGAVASVLQFLVVVGILIPILTANTNTGSYVLPANYSHTLNGTIATLNTTYISTAGGTSGPSLQEQMSNQTQQNAQINSGLLGSLGGLAFIPIAFGAFIKSMVNIPTTIINLFGSLFHPGTGAYFDIVLYCSTVIISGAMATYFVVIFAMKLASPILKTELEDV